MKTLVIVESVKKAKIIGKILDSNYCVQSCIGHVRELKGKNEGVVIAENFKPVFQTIKGKGTIIAKLRALAKDCDKVILATDEDREGEAIAWHLATLLKVDLNEKNRICFHEITKTAIMNAISNPKRVNMDMVTAQKTRQIQDYIIGFNLSPLTRKFAGGRSAGRVQSAVNKMVCQREDEVLNFVRKEYYHTLGYFNENSVKGKLNKRIEKKDNMMNFLEHCKTATFTVNDLQKRDCKRKPPAPFTTSTIQIEVNKRFKVPVKSIMNILQGLYQSGLITYHRTDSTTLSKEVLMKIKKHVVDTYGNKYLKLRNYKTQTKCAQEAHEAIRPTSISRQNLTEEYSDLEKKIYRLIWKRTVASQMADMEYEKYTLTIAISERSELFIANAEKVTFDGYTRLYNDKFKTEDDDDSDEDEANNTPFTGIKKGDTLIYTKITSTQKFTKPPPRFTEATLLKRMKDLGIGRPSTYASMITVVQDREYVGKKTFKGEKIDVEHLTLKEGNIIKKHAKETVGAEKNKLYATDLGKRNTEFLEEKFTHVVDYKYTAQMENELDMILNGEATKLSVLSPFYSKLQPILHDLQSKESTVKFDTGKRLVGKDQASGKNIYAYKAKFGPVLQIGENNDEDKRFVNLDKKYNVKSINEIEANSLTQFPKTLGKHKGESIVVTDGKYGYYLKHGQSNHKIKAEYNQFLSLEDAIDCIDNGKKSSLIKSFGKINIRTGNYGPYIQVGGKFVNIPNDIDPEGITKEQCEILLKNYKKPAKKVYSKKKK